MALSAVVICFVLLIIGLVIINFVYPFEGSLSFAAGIGIGCIHSVAKIILLEKSISKTLNLEKQNATNMERLHYMGRYFLTAAVFAVVILLRQYFGIIGAVVGVLSLQLSAYAASFILNKVGIE
jgi:hypothetical protein